MVLLRCIFDNTSWVFFGVVFLDRLTMAWRHPTRGYDITTLKSKLKFSSCNPVWVTNKDASRYSTCPCTHRLTQTCIPTLRRNWGSETDMSFARFVILVQTLFSESQSFWPGAVLLLTREQHTAFSRRYWGTDRKTMSYVLTNQMSYIHFNQHIQKPQKYSPTALVQKHAVPKKENVSIAYIYNVKYFLLPFCLSAPL